MTIAECMQGLSNFLDHIPLEQPPPPCIAQQDTYGAFLDKLGNSRIQQERSRRFFTVTREVNAAVASLSDTLRSASFQTPHCLVSLTDFTKGLLELVNPDESVLHKPINNASQFLD